MSRHALSRQRGAATLVVVMILFFIMAMMAAFANRSLLFEQRIASNYYRAGVAAEAADAGAEWALAMLNGGLVNGQCRGTGAPTSTFKDLYLVIDPVTRQMDRNPTGTGPLADCVRRAATGWQCQCPAPGAWAAAAGSEGATVQPSFRINLEKTNRAGVISVLADGCTSSSSAECLNPSVAVDASLGKSEIRIQVALVSALKMPPATPLTVAGNVTMDATGLGLHNSDPTSSGLLLLAGGTAGGWDETRLDSLPGSPTQQALITGDNTLSAAVAATPRKMFAMYFGMSPALYRTQPATREVSCSANCTTELVTAYGQGVRVAWIQGDATLASNVILGTAAAPMLVIVNGNLTLSGPMQFNGVIYAAGNIAWTNTSAQLALINGALIGEGAMASVGRVDLWYQGSVINALNNQTGSFVRVPGSWWDQPLPL